MARIRSPNYPAISLKEAIEKVARVFERERQHPASKETVMKGMGYGGVNGASLTALSAAKKYGLIQRDGEDYRVSDQAVAILHPHTPNEKAEALRRAALSPKLFSELLDYYKGDSVSDDNLRAYLVRRGFAQSALAEVIRSFRETMELVPPLPTGYSKLEVASEEDDEPELQVSMGTKGALHPILPPPDDDTHLLVSIKNGRLEVTASLADERDIDKLIKILTLNKILFQATTEASDAG